MEPPAGPPNKSARKSRRRTLQEEYSRSAEDSILSGNGVLTMFLQAVNLYALVIPPDRYVPPSQRTEEVKKGDGGNESGMRLAPLIDRSEQEAFSNVLSERDRFLQQVEEDIEEYENKILKEEEVYYEWRGKLQAGISDPSASEEARNKVKASSDAIAKLQKKIEAKIEEANNVGTTFDLLRKGLGQDAATEIRHAQKHFEQVSRARKHGNLSDQWRLVFFEAKESKTAAGPGSGEACSFPEMGDKSLPVVFVVSPNFRFVESDKSGWGGIPLGAIEELRKSGCIPVPSIQEEPPAKKRRAPAA